jgi:predicted MFS family arabinose efflux permease
MNVAISKGRAVAWSIWILASLFYAYQYILRVMPSIMFDDIMNQFHISSALFGQFSGLYYIGYSLMHLPIGIMLDRFGPKKVMTGSILLSVLGLMPLIFSNYWVYPIVGRVLIGMGSSAAILGVFKIVRMAFSEARFARMLSISVTIGLIGAIYGGGPLSYMCHALGYQAVIQIFALLGVVLALITYFVVPNVETPPQRSVLSDVRQVLTNQKVILTCFFAGLMVGPLEGFADVWSAVFLKQVYGFETTISASLPSVIFMGMCFGAPLLSLIAERIGYLQAIISSGFLMALSFAALLMIKLPSFVLGFSFVLIGIASAYQILAIYKASTYVKEEVAGLTTALANMIIMIFGYAFHTIIGVVVSKMGGPTESIALINGIAVIPIALLIGTTGFIFLARQKAAA